MKMNFKGNTDKYTITVIYEVKKVDNPPQPVQKEEDPVENKEDDP
jgi:hypothetical protein